MNDTDVHHLRLWNLASDTRALSAHVVVTREPTPRTAQRTGEQVKGAVADRFAITNVTLELEVAPLPEVAAVR
jgi:Co/Zn/Cd efflux system component